MSVILFDIGRSKTRIAYSENKENFEEPVVFETSSDYKSGLQRFIELAEKCVGNREVGKIIGGISRSIPNWSDEQLQKDLEEKFGGSVFIENDATMAGLGEANFGAGKGFEIVAYITVSTGVGGARIVNNIIDKHSIGFEPGKQIVDMEDGTNKTLEDLISGRALSEKTSKHPREITLEPVWDDLAKKLAVGLNNIIVEWSPGVVVLGGSMITGDPAIPLDKTEKYLKGILKIFPEIPPIKKASLGDFGGLWGALAYLKTNPQQ